jgi:hypothetical protein
MGETMGKGGAIMSPEEYPLYWFMIVNHNRLRTFLAGEDGFDRQALSYLLTIRLFSPEKDCEWCHQRIGLLEVLRNSSNLDTERQFAHNGEQLYRFLNHVDCPSVKR